MRDLEAKFDHIQKKDEKIEDLQHQLVLNEQKTSDMVILTMLKNFLV